MPRLLWRKRGANAQIFCDELISKIGLEADDNRNLTRRVLLVLESVALTNPKIHRRCTERVLDVYLDHSIKDFRPPRFFLNDLVRYWRTMCIDFVGKERLNPAGEKWDTDLYLQVRDFGVF